MEYGEEETSTGNIGVLQETWIKGRQEGRRESLGELDAGTAEREGEECSERAEEEAQEKGVGRPWCAVYVLLNENKEVFYVGRTENPKKRLIAHRNRFGKDVKMRLVQNVFINEGPSEAELKWIRHYTDLGCDLANSIGFSERHEDTLQFRVKPEDKAAFERQAAAEGLTLSAWIRMHLLALVKKGAKK